jgi:PD-(D/E)XK nuclease superfamily
MTSELSHRNAHPRDEQVRLEIETHTYFIDGSSEGVTSVTTFLGEFFPPFDPEAVIEKYYDRWQENDWKKPEYYGKTKVEIKEMWKKSGKEACTLGMLLHAAIEAFYNDHEVMYDQNSKEWKYFQSFQQEHNLNAYRTEMMVWSSDHKLAGMIDLLVRNEDGTISIYDWKRTKSRVYEQESSWGRYASRPLSRLRDNKFYRYAMQLNLYRELLERYYDFNVVAMYIVRLHPAALQYEVVEVDRMEKEAGDLLDARKTSMKVDTDLDTDLVEALQILAV